LRENKWMSDEYSEGQLKSVLRTESEWYEAFEENPGFALLSESQQDDAGAVTEFFAKYTYEYLGLEPKEWNEAAVHECLTDILPRKVSAEPAFFESVAPVLGNFFTFLAERGLLANGRKLGETAKKLHGDIIAAAGDRSTWGPAKSMVMAAQEAGVDIRNENALRAFMLELNLRQMAVQAKSSGPRQTGPAAPPAFGTKSKRSYAEVGPYEPCPCGSGRKFKFCCRGAYNSAQHGRTEAQRTQSEWNQATTDGEPPFMAELRPDLDDKVDQLMQQLEAGAGRTVEPKIRALLQKHPGYHMTHYAMGAYLGAVENNPAAALPFFERAVEIFPPFPEGHFNVGTAAMKTADIAKAVAGFRAAVRYSGKDDRIAEMAREQLQFLEKAALKGTTFKSLDAYIANAQLFDAAFQCLSEFQFEDAVKKFKRVLDGFPNHVQSYGNMALAYAGLGKKAAAMECFEKALALDPSYEPARANRRTMAAMREGEPFIPGGIQEVHYYADRLRAENPRAES